MASAFKTPRTAIQDYTKDIATEKTLRVTRKRQPLSRSPRSKDGSLARPGGSTAKVSRSSSVSELSEDTPRHLISGFLTTHSSTLPLTRHQSRISVGRDMPPPSSRSKRNQRRSSLGIPQVDDIVKKFTPRTAIQGLLSQAPEETPITGNIGERKSRSYISLPGIDSLLRDPSFEPLHKSFVGDFPSTGKARNTTRQHRPIQLDAAHQRKDDEAESEGEMVQNFSPRRTSTRLNISSPQSASHRKSQRKKRNSSTSVTDKDTTTPSPNRHQSFQTDTQIDENAEYSPSRRRSQRNETETNTSSRRLTLQSDTLSDPIDTESVTPASTRASRRTILTPSLPSSRRMSQVEEDAGTKTFHEFASQTSPTAFGRSDAATSVSPRSRRSSFQSEVGRSNFSARGRRSSHTQPISISVDQNIGTQTATPTKSLSLHQQAMRNASHTADDPESLFPSPAGRSLSQAGRVEHIENVVPSPTGKRRSSLKQTTIDFSFTGHEASSQTSDVSSRVHSSQRNSVGVGNRSIGDDSRMSTSNLGKRTSQSFDSSSHAKRSRLSVSTSTLSVEDGSSRRQSSARKRSLGQTDNEDTMAYQSSSKRSSVLRQINSESDFISQSSSRRSMALRELNSEPDFISQSSPKRTSSLREIDQEADIARQSSPRRSSILQQSHHSEEFAEDTDEIDGDAISSVVQSVIGRLASENEENLEEDVEPEAAGEELMATHEEEDEQVGEVEEEDEEVEDGEEEDDDVEMADGQTSSLKNKNSHTDHTEKPVTKAQKPRKPRKQPDYLPVSVVKQLFTHFSRARVSKEAIAEVVNISGKFWKSIAGDLESYAEHAHRKTIRDEDVALLMRRQGFITDKKPLSALVYEYLPLELRQQVLPIARSGNKIELDRKILS